MDVIAAIINVAWLSLWPRCLTGTGCALAVRCKWHMVLRCGHGLWERPLVMDKLVLFAATPEMVAKCYCVMHVTVGSTGTA